MLRLAVPLAILRTLRLNLGVSRLSQPKLGIFRALRPKSGISRLCDRRDQRKFNLDGRDRTKSNHARSNRRKVNRYRYDQMKANIQRLDQGLLFKFRSTRPKLVYLNHIDTWLMRFDRLDPNCLCSTEAKLLDWAQPRNSFNRKTKKQFRPKIKYKKWITDDQKF